MYKLFEKFGTKVYFAIMYYVQKILKESKVYFQVHTCLEKCKCKCMSGSV